MRFSRHFWVCYQALNTFNDVCAQDPGEGPSWLFADKSKKKKRSSTARQLSALFSESERESGATTGASTSGMDTSDISLDESNSADSSTEVILISGVEW